MNKPDRNQYYKLYSTVIVCNSVGSSLCNKCKKNNQEFSVFLGSDTKLSTLFGYYCSDCLPLLVKEANIKGQYNFEKYYNNACKRYYEECVQYVRKTKLDNLGNIIKE